MADSTQNSTKNSNRRGRGKELAPWQWKPGQSGNPGGRPKRKPITDAYKEYLQALDKSGFTAAQRIAQTMILRAIAGDVPATKEVTDRVEGTVKQALDILFGDLTDEQLSEYIAAQSGIAGAGSVGGAAEGDTPADDPSPGTPQSDDPAG